MSKLFKSKFLLGVMVVAIMVVGFAVSAKSASADCSLTLTLRIGSTGTEVQCLQGKLGIAADGKFGPMTNAAVKAFQAGKGLSADGVVGPKTRAALMGANPVVSNGCQSGWAFNPATGQPCSTTGGNTGGNTGDLEGTDGTISDITQLSQYSAEEVGSGSEDVKILGFEVEASSDGDIQLNSMKVRFDSTGNAAGDSDRLEDYLSSVSIMQGSEVVGSADVDEFTRVSSGLYTKVISLKDSVVKADEKEKFYVVVNGANNLDSGDIDSDSWTVALDNVRYEDGDGVVTTETAEIPADMDWDAAGDGVSFVFVSFSSASDTKLKISADNTPASTTVSVDDTENTDNVVMLKGKIKLEGDSDVWLDELPVTLTATGDSPVAITGSVTLTIDGQTFNETVSTSNASTATITFNDLDLTIDAGDTVDFTVSADINDLEDTGAAATDFDAGDQLTISLTTTNRAAIVAENEQGDALTDGTEMTGSATGNAMTFRATGVNVDMGTVTYSNVSDQNGVVTQQTFTIPVTVTSFGDTLYMGQSGQFAATATASNAFAVVFENSTAPTTADVTSSASIAISTTDALISSNGFVLDEDDAKHFVIEVTQTVPGYLGAVTAGNYRVRLDELRVFTGAGLESAATATNIDLVPTSEFRTGFKYITS